MPNASAPKAPWVEVWESPQTTVMPGWVRPSCGPTTCTMPCSASPRGCSGTPNSRQLARSVSTCVRDTGSAIGRSMSVVGTLWSSVAIVRAGRGVVGGGGEVVVWGGDRRVRAADGSAGEPQAVERLRAGHLVHQVKIDVEQ